MLDSAFGVGVVLAPQTNELVEVMRSQNGPVARQVVKVVHDNGHEEIDDQERADDVEGDEVSIGKGCATKSLFWLFRSNVAFDSVPPGWHKTALLPANFHLEETDKYSGMR